MDNSKHFSANKQYDLYSAYTQSEMMHKTNWEEIPSDEKIDYLKRLEEAGYKPIHQNAAMEETLEEFKKRYDKEVKNKTVNDIPIAENIKNSNRKNSARNIPERPIKEKNPRVKKTFEQKRPRQPKAPEVMSKEEQKTKFSLKNIVNYFKAEQSLATQGPVSLTVYEERKKICGECPHRKTHAKIPDPLGFCTKCGCGANPRARLTNKIKMPQTSCPLDKWGKSTGIYKGVVGKIRHKLTPKSKREELDYT
tara:strand:- start:222 stop:974 length:753 start_codon:yes stop_codon:yes gene_type:complete